jgi:AAA+ ATPase superfamily predicted ATPase
VAFGVAGGVAFGITFIAGVLRLWFWLPELIWMIGLYFTAPRQHSKALCYLPTTIDELIILPLPFMDRLIIRAYHENPALARQTITHLTTHTNQQKVAARAMVGIAIDTLNHAKTATEISQMATELRWLPSPPPAAVGKLLPKLLDISRDVHAALNATTPYLRSELLNKPLTDLEDLSQQLAFSGNAHQATQFGAIIPKWQTCLQTAQKNFAQQMERSREIPLVYVAGPVLNPSVSGLRFRGRIDLFREIEHLMLATQPPILLLHGGRRTGKTSLIKHLPEKVGSHFLPLLIDFQGAASLTTLTYIAKYIAKQAIQSAREDHNLTLPAADAEVLKEEPFYALQEWLDEVEKTVGNRRILLCLDEFERLDEIVKKTGSRAPLNFLRHVMQHRRQWVLLFSGAHLIQELPNYWSDYLINTRTLKVSYLDEADARLLITTPIEKFPDIYAPAAIDAIIHCTRCQPYLVQLLCYTVVEQLNQEKRRYAEAHDVTAAIPKALQSGHEYFNELWQLRLTEKEREIVRRVLTGDHFAKSDKTILQALINKEVIEPVQNKYQFQVPMVKDFIAQTMD